MAALLGGAATDSAQAQVVDSLSMTSQVAETWTSDRGEQVIALSGPLTIKASDTTLNAERAIVWISYASAPRPLEQIQIVLFENASVETPTHTRSGQQLYVTLTLSGPLTVEAGTRLARDASNTPLYRNAEAFRKVNAAEADAARTSAVAVSTTQPTTRPSVSSPASADQGWTVRLSGAIRQPAIADGRVTAIVDGLVMLVRWGEGDYAELQADRAVIFTPFEELSADALKGVTAADQAVDAVYLEGDVRINYAPADATVGAQRLRARDAYFDLGTRKAILTKAVLHTTDPQSKIPIVVRARALHQVAVGEYRAQDVTLTTSSFRRPSYELQTQQIHVRQSGVTDPDGADPRASFAAKHTFFKFSGIPLFYLPYTSGTLTDGRLPIREIRVGNSSIFGVTAQTEWGLFETLGLTRPDGLDARYKLDYYSDRGFAGGLDAEYDGGFVTESGRQPWNFIGDLESFFVDDRNQDQFGGRRGSAPSGEFDDWPDDVRGYAVWRHQHLFPYDWQVQLQGAYVSDATFLEQWREDEFTTGLPKDESLYVKRQQQTEAFTFLVNWQPNKVVTISDYQQEQFEVERLPELGYHRVGDDLFGAATNYLDASAAALHFQLSETSLADQGFGGDVLPGIPSLGQTGVTDDLVYRADVREQVNFPIPAGPFKFMPYVMGRYTGYTESPANEEIDRVLGGAGLRLTTAFWSINNTVESQLLDIHRIRHVVEPELHLFTSVSNVDRTDVYIFEEPVDAVSELAAAQIALRQRWQTKRGGPGRWRNVDVFTLDVEGNFFSDVPDDPLVQPISFRGLMFRTLPEASIPRDTIYADASWRVTDTTVVLADAAYNLEEDTLATAAIGIAAHRGDRLFWSVGTRYIDLLNSNITTVTLEYKITEKYRIAATESFDFGQEENVGWSVTLTRKFDQFFLQGKFEYDVTDDLSSFSLNFVPEFIGISSKTLGDFVPQQ